MSLSHDDPIDKPRPFGSALRPWLLIGAAFFVTFALLRQASTANKRPAGQANYSWKVAGLDGRTSSLEAYRGKPVFLNVWATWCGPCRQEMPSIARLAANPRLKGVAFLCVSQDDAPDEVKAYLSVVGKQPMTMLHARAPAPRPFRNDGIPATFILAPDGRIVRSEVGGMEWDTAEVVELLESLTKG